MATLILLALFFWTGVTGMLIFTITEKPKLDGSFYFAIIIFSFLAIVFTIKAINAILEEIEYRKQEEAKYQYNDDGIHYLSEREDIKSVPKTKKEVINTSPYRKKKLLTKCETEWYKAIQSILPQEYFVQPQINLASIIEKNSNSPYASELFRNIDFGIFDKKSNILILIEINDKTHFDKKRMERDYKVSQICKQAQIPLITFWVENGINPDYIWQEIKKYL